MDFYKIKQISTKNGVTEVFPDFKVRRSKDLMVRGQSFYAVFDKETGLWSTDEYDVQRLVDKELYEYSRELEKKHEGNVRTRYMSDFSSRTWSQFKLYLKNLADNAKEIDARVTFQNTDVKQTDYASRRLEYPLEEGSIEAYEEMVSSLYSQEERDKIEWAIGSVFAGDSRSIQKFLVFYGPPGTGKSTIINLIQKLFKGYYSTFDAASLVKGGSEFGTSAFKDNHLVAIQHDGDLSKIENNAALNSITSHEAMRINEKFKPTYTSEVNSFLFMGTNKPVHITDSKSGIIRRLIDVYPKGYKIPVNRYHTLISQIDFELGAIAHHCLNKYREMGKNYYANYVPIRMMIQTDTFYNFAEMYMFEFAQMGHVTLTQAYDMYKSYCEDSKISYPLQRHKFREELKEYFEVFEDVTRIDGRQVRSVYSGFRMDKFEIVEETQPDVPMSISLTETKSLIDEVMKDYPAQYASSAGTPKQSWDKVKTTVKDLDTSKMHYVNGPINHIVIDFDLKDESGNKSAELNLEAASKFPPTYAEYSQGGAGVHLHYYYDGDTDVLANVYEEDIEVKVYRGDASIRRRLSFCNNIPMATISSGLPTKGVKMINAESVQSEKALRDLIDRNLKKEIHPGTKPSIDFITKILQDAYDSGLAYDVSNMKRRVLAFANNSTNNAHYCLKQVLQMKFASEVEPEPQEAPEDLSMAFYDLEVYPNLLMVGWKLPGPENKVNVMINPTSDEVGTLFNNYRLVGFNNRRYDNHVLYARYLGYSNERIYQLSQDIINNKSNPFFREAYSLAYADVYEFSSIKMSLKKWMIELNIFHKEMELPWDQPVPEEKWQEVADYMINDVIATEEVFNARATDFTARKILSKLSGLPMYNTTRQHATRIFFGDNRNPQKEFVYTDLSEMFPGYKYENGVSTYRGYVASEGGFVYSEPNIWKNVALLDIESLHPTSAVNMNIFGPYTKVLVDLLNARLGIKHGDYEPARTVFDGALAEFLVDESATDELAYTFKIVINSIYGWTAARFENAFRDPRNVDNIVAKRGALFMIDLLHAVSEQGYTVAHIKTDSIKIPNADDTIIKFVKDFGAKYGYKFMHEATYAQMCLVNDAVYIAKTAWSIKEKEIGKWSATGAQFAHPYVFKNLFSKEEITFEDLCETKAVKSAMYLNFNEDGVDDMRFVGKTGMYVPIQPGHGGAELIRVQDDKHYAVTGTKGYRWMEATDAKAMGYEKYIDYSYYEELKNNAVAAIEEYGNFDEFYLYNWPEDCVVEDKFWKEPVDNHILAEKKISNLKVAVA